MIKGDQDLPFPKRLRDWNFAKSKEMSFDSFCWKLRVGPFLGPEGERSTGPPAVFDFLVPLEKSLARHGGFADTGARADGGAGVGLLVKGSAS